MPKKPVKKVVQPRYDEAFIASLVATLSAPPEPPRPPLTLGAVLEAVSAQIVALFKSGYTQEQVLSFLYPEGVPQRAEVARFVAKCGTSARRKAPAPAVPDSVPATQETPSGFSPVDGSVGYAHGPL